MRIIIGLFALLRLFDREDQLYWVGGRERGGLEEMEIFVSLAFERLQYVLFQR